MSLHRFFEGIRLGMTPQAADYMSSVHGGGGDEKQESNSTSTPYQKEQYDKLLAGADSWLSGGGFDKNYGGSAGFNPTAGFTSGQQAGLAGSDATGKAAQGLYDSQGLSTLANYFGTYDPNKTGLTGAIDASNNRLDWNYNTGVAPQVRQGATDSGQYGSTRHGVAEGIALSNLSQQKTDAASTLAYQDQQAYNQNQLNILNNLSGITKGLNSGNGLQYDAGTLQQQQNQAEINGQLQKWAYENNVSLNDLIAYQQLVSGNMGGTSTSESSGGGGGSSALGTIGTVGGAVVGGFFGGPAGAAAGATVGGAVGNGLS
jgi:hypothetical protein